MAAIREKWKACRWKEAKNSSVLTREANARFGKGNWVLTHAYGDHHSDRTLLAAAQHPFAVTPDRPLRRTARNREWPILNWR